jgi:hypothetical protein
MAAKVRTDSQVLIGREAMTMNRRHGVLMRGLAGCGKRGTGPFSARHALWIIKHLLGRKRLQAPFFRNLLLGIAGVLASLFLLAMIWMAALRALAGVAKMLA